MGPENMFVEFLEDCTIGNGNIIINQTKNDIKFDETLNSNTIGKSSKQMDKTESIKNLQLKHYRGKCAEIFIENGECYVVCEFCDINFKSLEVFLCHIYKRHLIMKNPYHEMFSLLEEQLVASQTMEQSQTNITTKIKSTKPKLKIKNQVNIKPLKKYLIDIENNTDILNQNLIEVIEEDDLNNDDTCCPIQQENLNPFKTTIVLKTEHLNSKISLPSDNHEINLNEFTIIDSDKPQLEQRANDLQDEFNITTSIINNESINYDSTFCCEICNELFTNSKDYKKHYEQHQNEWKNYTCPLCPKSFGSTFFQEIEFNAHMRRHLQQQNQKDFTCQHCNEIFLKHSDLLRHIEIYHNNLYMIDNSVEHCNELFGDSLDNI